MKESVRWSDHFQAFEMLTSEERQTLVELMTFESYPCGTVLVHQGVVETRMYFLARGYVEVLLATNSGHQLLTMLKAGEHFGEAALFTDRPRSATVQAATDVEVWALDRGMFQQLMGEEPALCAHLLQGLLREHLDRLQRTSTEMLSQKVLYSRYSATALAT